MSEVRSRIVVVEDDANIMVALRTRLDHEGYQVACAPDGEHAKALVEYFRPDLLIVDINLPFVNGIQLLKWVDDHSERDIPRILITASRDPTMRKECELQKQSVFIEKPFTSSYLMMKVEESLANNAMAH